VLSTFDRVFTALTLGVGGIAAISLGVAGILIMNVMLIAVSQRTTEIGLLKAIGGQERQILSLFLAEAGLLALVGAAFGLILALIGVWVMGKTFPSFPVPVPFWALGAATAVSLSSGLVFGVLPARRAAKLDPVQALSRR
jgi:putative ABC transport system permease protein